MTRNMRIYSKFEGYTIEDCSCKYCLHYAGKKKSCPLDECCCAEEKRLALERESPASGIRKNS